MKGNTRLNLEAELDDFLVEYNASPCRTTAMQRDGFAFWLRPGQLPAIHGFQALQKTFFRGRTRFRGDVKVGCCQTQNKSA
jgi:hypothetical protein